MYTATARTLQAIGLIKGTLAGQCCLPVMWHCLGPLSQSARFICCRADLHSANRIIPENGNRPVTGNRSLSATTKVDPERSHAVQVQTGRVHARLKWEFAHVINKRQLQLPPEISLIQAKPIDAYSAQFFS